MRPYSKYIFTKHPEKNTRYVLKEVHGESIPQFPAVYQIGPDIGKKYIGFRKTQRPQSKGHRYFEYTLELASNKTFTGFNFSELNPDMGIGDDRSIGLCDCVLIEFSPDRTELTLWFFKNMADVSQVVLEKWLSGDIPKIVESECIEIKKADSQD